MVKTITKVGNSQGLIFDATLLEMARLRIGDEVNVEVHDGGTITVTPKLGYTDAATSPAITYTMSLGRQRLRRLGNGPMVQLNFRNNVAAQDCELWGYEIEPIFELGRR